MSVLNMLVLHVCTLIRECCCVSIECVDVCTLSIRLVMYKHRMLCTLWYCKICILTESLGFCSFSSLFFFFVCVGKLDAFLTESASDYQSLNNVKLFKREVIVHVVSTYVHEYDDNCIAMQKHLACIAWWLICFASFLERQRLYRREFLTIFFVVFFFPL